MTTELKITRADPAGNLTLLVEGAVPPEMRAAVGAALIQLPEFQAEQAGFLVPPRAGGIGRLEMSGGEFCGNAVRACGLLLAQRMNLPGDSVPIEISGCEDPVVVTVDRDSGFVTAEMPLPETISMVSLPAPFGLCPLVRFSGIWHVIAENIPATEQNFIAARDAVYTRWAPEAFGVMFLTDDALSLTPFVYVKDSGTLFRENSCGSGTAAVAAWYAANGKSGSVTLRQPGGVLQAQIDAPNGILRGLTLGGPVRLEEPVVLSFPP